MAFLDFHVDSRGIKEGPKLRDESMQQRMVLVLKVLSCLFVTSASAYLQSRTTPPTAFVLIGDSTTATT